LLRWFNSKRTVEHVTKTLLFQFVVKFIRKEKVLDECWVDDYEFDSMIPLEIALLAKYVIVMFK